MNPQALLQRARDGRPGFDHVIRAYLRYSADAGDRQAAAVTFFGFLSFFPLLALAASVLGYVLGDDAVRTVVREVNAYVPGLADQLRLRELLTDNRKVGTSGLIGLVGLLYSGLGWVDALREAIRTMWHHDVQDGNLILKKVKDIVVLAGLGATVVVSVGVSAAGGAFAGYALDLVGLEGTGRAKVIITIVGVVLGLLASTALFLYLFWRLPKVTTPLRQVLRGAVLAAVLFEVLKQVGAFYIARTTANPIYGTFAVIVGLLVWINLVSRLLLLCAAWTVTGPYNSDVEPSGTAHLAIVAPDPDDPPAPSGVVAVVERPAPPRAALARQAGQFTAGALGMVLTAVLLHVLRTLKGVLKR